MGVIRNSMHDFVISPPPSPSPIKGEGITVISTGMTPPPYRSNLAESPGRAGGLPHRIMTQCNSLPSCRKTAIQNIACMTFAHYICLL